MSNPRGVLVIGAAETWGRAILEAVASRGDRGLGCDRPGARGGSRPGGGSSESRPALVADESEEEGAERLFEIALARLPALDVVVWIAPAIEVRPPLVQTERSDWESAVSAPLRAAGHVCRLAVGEFLSTGNAGRIVLVAPLVSDRAPGQSAAASSSSGLAALGRSVAKEYGSRGITCNLILPRGGARGAPSGGLVEAALYLASAEASYVNGECLSVDVPSAVESGVL